MVSYSVKCRNCAGMTYLGKECKACGYFNKWPVMK